MSIDTRISLRKIKLSVDGGTAFEDFVSDLCDLDYFASIIDDIDYCYASPQDDGSLVINVFVNSNEASLHIDPKHWEAYNQKEI